MPNARLIKRILLGVLGGALLLALSSIITVQWVSRARLNATFEQKVSALPNTNATPEGVARGDYLVNNLLGCGYGNCHQADFGGGPVMDAPPMGRVYAPNLTAGRGGVTADYSGEDWARLLRHGLKKDGRRALLMPSEDYVKFSDTDLSAAVAYLESLPAVDRDSPGHEPGFLLRFLLTIGAIRFSYDTIDHQQVPAPATPSASKEWGAVLIGTCTGCHGLDLSGGPIQGGDPSWAPARNITPDPKTGIGNWTYNDFAKAMREGKRPDGTEVKAPMPWQLYNGMGEDDVRALWEYVRSVPAKSGAGR